MGATIITGYSGTRHITPAMDAAIYRSSFGEGEYVLSDGNKCKGSMPSVTQFEVLGGLISMQGHQIQITQETLAVDTCANGYERIDLVCCRFTHDNNTLIDTAQLVVIKGTEVQTGNTPTVPSHNTGTIDAGATIVDMPLYEIDLAGSNVTFDRLFQRIFSAEELQPLPLTKSTVSSLPVTITDDRILKEHETKDGLVQLSNPSAQIGDWDWTTADGSITISGSISGTTNISLWLEIPREKKGA